MSSRWRMHFGEDVKIRVEMRLITRNRDTAPEPEWSLPVVEIRELRRRSDTATHLCFVLFLCRSNETKPAFGWTSKEGPAKSGYFS